MREKFPCARVKTILQKEHTIVKTLLKDMKKFQLLITSDISFHTRNITSEEDPEKMKKKFSINLNDIILILT